VTDLENLKLSQNNGVAEVVINRPHKANALDRATWDEIGLIFSQLDQDSKVRAIVIRGEGKGFCSGIDFAMVMELVGQASSLEEGEKQDHILRTIRHLQDAFTAIETCRKPVIAAIHGACYGGGVDLISACDIRLGTKDTTLCVKEIDLGIVADVGTLQRLPHIIGQGLTRELAFTGRKFSGEEAKGMGLLNHAYNNQEDLFAAASQMAKEIASKSPLTIRGIKQVMNQCRDLSVRDGLEYVAAWNAGMLLSRDGQEAFTAMVEKRSPQFKD